MIDSLSNLGGQQAFANALSGQIKQNQKLSPQELQGLADGPSALKGLSDGPTSFKGPSKDVFGQMIGDLVKEVDHKGKVAAAETNKLLLGETDNIHQSMIAMQESGLAFSMLVEVRNKLVSSYQELMKMPV